MGEALTVSDVYQRVCSRFLEPYNPGPGLQSGIFTLSDFLQHFSGVFPDWMERTGYTSIIATGAIHIGISTYQIPDQCSHVSNVFVSGRLLRRTNLQELNTTVYQWRKHAGIPRDFLEDGLPVKQVEVYPVPNYEGSPMATSGQGVIDPPETNEYMQIGDFWPALRGYTLTGTQVPLNPDLTPQASWQLTDPIIGIPDSAVPYLAFGVLTKMFSDDSEAKDEARARYCSSRYEEGISIFRSILAEKLYDDPDGAM